MNWWKKIEQHWWGSILLGVAMMMLGFYERGKLLTMETGQAKSVWVDPITWIFYSIFGTGGVLFFWMLIAIVLIAKGIHMLVQNSR